ncbi:MAG: hypothetical protein LBV75_00310 [Paludibacter sp.]|nr:hypothetical protein [Paludibacter sp.]
MKKLYYFIIFLILILCLVFFVHRISKANIYDQLNIETLLDTVAKSSLPFGTFSHRNHTDIIYQDWDSKIQCLYFLSLDKNNTKYIRYHDSLLYCKIPIDSISFYFADTENINEIIATAEFMKDNQIENLRRETNGNILVKTEKSGTFWHSTDTIPYPYNIYYQRFYKNWWKYIEQNE